MAIARDSHASLNITVPSNSIGSQSYSMGSGDNRILFVAFRNNSDNGDFVNGVSYGGVAMTLGQKSRTGAFDTAYFYYLINPPSGANNLSISNNFGTGNPQNYVGYIGSYVGVGSINASLFTTDASCANNTHSITPTVPNCWAAVLELNIDGAPAAGSGANLVGTGNGSGGFDSNGVVASGSAYSMTITVSAGSRIGMWNMFSLAPFVPGGAGLLEALAGA